MKSFKQYLITEKVNKSEYSIVESDPNFIIGAEFEYFDDGIRAYIGNDMSESTFDAALDDYIGYIKNYKNEYKEDRAEWVKDQFDMINAHKQDYIIKKDKIIKELDKLLPDGFEDLSVKNKSEIDKLQKELDDFRETMKSIIVNRGIGSDEHVNIGLKIKDNKDKINKLYGVNELESDSNKILDLKEELLEIYEILPDFEDPQISDFEDLSNYIDDIESESDFIDGFSSNIPMPHDELIEQWQGVHGWNYTRIIDFMEDRVMDFIKSNKNEFMEFIPEAFRSSSNPFSYDTDFNFEEIVENGFDMVGFPYSNNVDINLEGDYTNWNIVPDGSLDLQDGGIEIVSPKMNFKFGFKAIYNLFKFINRHGKTTRKTGFHINMSYKGFNLRKLDVFKMMLFMEEGLITKHFPEREYNKMTVYMLPQIKSNMKMSDAFNRLKKEDKLTVNKFNTSKKQILNDILPINDKFQGINQENRFLPDGRIEFRYLGGSNYHTKFDLIKTQILRYAYLLKLGMNPDFKKKEYLSKLMKLAEKTQYDKGVYHLDKKEERTKYATDTKGKYSYYIMKDHSANKEIIIVYEISKTGQSEVFSHKIDKQKFDKLMKANPNIKKV